MPTRDFYVGVSRKLRPHQGTLAIVLFLVWFAGFAAFALEAVPGDVFVLAKLWFTACILLGVFLLCTLFFEPQPEAVGEPPADGRLVIMINVALLMTAWIWFWSF